MSQPYPNQAPDQNPSGTYYQQPAAEDPGKTLGIIGLVLAFVTGLIGLIVSAVALSKSKKAGFKNIPALVGIIVGALYTAGVVISIIAVIAIGATAAGDIAKKCAELGPGTHQSGGVTYTCS